ncbi:MAG: alpha/beta hydrolase [Planctomycetales bacterium]|nr:alpha/beta hydrolase [Planctomycetales bacterium]
MLAVTFINTASAAPPEAKPLWPDGAPHAVGTEESDIPTLRHYPAEPGNGAAVIICPGGGYGVLAYDHEGHQVAQFLASRGVTAFVLRYRHSPSYRHPVPLQDAQRAIRHVRHHAKQLGVDPQRIGIMGFSAGGHLASTAATHFDSGHADAADPVDRVGCRPDFAVLCYPVISMTESWGHRGSRNNLLGDRANDEELAKSLSNDQQVTKETPRTFLFHTAQDRGVPVENSLAFYRALMKHGVPGELHVYQHGPHGVGLAHGDPVLSTWPERLIEWMRGSNLLSGVERAGVTGTIALDGEPLGWGTVSFESSKADGKWQPSGWAMVRNGKFSIAAPDGPGLGEHRVRITNWGAVKPLPTIEKATEISSSLQVNIAAGKNDFSFELTK